MMDNTVLFKARVKMLKNKESKTKETESQRHVRTFPHDDTTKASAKSSENYRTYNKEARDVLQDITEFRNLVLDKRKGYILCSDTFSTYGDSLSDTDRKKFDNQVDTAVKQCSRLIQQLDKQTSTDKKLRDDELKHLKYVTRLLNIYLKEVCSIVAMLSVMEFESDDEEVKTPQNLKAYSTEFNLKVVKHAMEISNNSASSKFGISRSCLQDWVNNSSPERRLKKKIQGGVVRSNSRISTSKWQPGSIHLKKSQHIRKICRLANLVDMYENSIAVVKKEEEEQSKRLRQLHEEIEEKNEQYLDPLPSPSRVDGWEDAEEVDVKNIRSKNQFFEDIDTKPVFEPAESDEVKEEFEELSKVEQAQLMTENKGLYQRISHSNTEIMRIESQLAEIQKLQNTFTEKIVEQERDIDSIHTQTVHTLDNLETANQFIRESIKNTATRRVIALFCLIVLTFTLLFLDWYNP